MYEESRRRDDVKKLRCFCAQADGVPAKLTGRDTHVLGEEAREMTVLFEPQFGRNVGEWLVARAE